MVTCIRIHVPILPKDNAKRLQDDAQHVIHIRHLKHDNAHTEWVVEHSQAKGSSNLLEELLPFPHTTSSKMFHANSNQFNTDTPHIFDHFIKIRLILERMFFTVALQFIAA